MQVIIRKPFSYAHDGFTVRDLVPSDRDPPETEEVRDELVDGLVAAGFVATEQGAAHVQQSTVEAKADPAADDVHAGADQVVGQASDGEPVVEGERPALSELFNGADPAAFDHDRDGKPGGSLKLDGLAAIADVDLTAAPLVAGEPGAITSPDVVLPPLDASGPTLVEEGTASATFDPDTADEAALRAFLTTRDGKEPDKRFGPDRLRALAKAAPGADDQGE